MYLKGAVRDLEVKEAEEPRWVREENQRLKKLAADPEPGQHEML